MGLSTPDPIREAPLVAMEKSVDEYLDGYTCEFDEGSHTPGDFERFVIKDAILGLLEDEGFKAASAALQPDAGQPHGDSFATWFGEDKPGDEKAIGELTPSLRRTYRRQGWDAATKGASVSPAGQLQQDAAQPAQWEFDDGSTFQLTGFAGGAAPGGVFSTVMCEHMDAAGKVTVMQYVRVPSEQVEATQPAPEAQRDERDAARYRWLRDVATAGDWEHIGQTTDPANTDARIDECMAAYKDVVLAAASPSPSPTEGEKRDTGMPGAEG